MIRTEDKSEQESPNKELGTLFELARFSRQVGNFRLLVRCFFEPHLRNRGDLKLGDSNLQAAANFSLLELQDLSALRISIVPSQALHNKLKRSKKRDPRAEKISAKLCGEPRLRTEAPTPKHGNESLRRGF